MSVNEKLRSAQHDELFEGILQLQTVEECYAFFEDICTVNELKALSQRLQVAKMLRAGDSYETIVEETGASTATISRVKRCLVYGADGYTVVLDRLAGTKYLYATTVADGHRCFVYRAIVFTDTNGKIVLYFDV